MKFVSFTDFTGNKILIDSKTHSIPVELKDDYVKLFKQAKSGRVAWDDNIDFRIMESDDGYKLSAYYGSAKIFDSYGVMTERGKQDMMYAFPGEMRAMKNEKVPFVIDILDPRNYLTYILGSTVIGNYDSRSTGTLSVAAGLLAFEGDI